jgi:hydroxymethylpyrimidine pyrophosphatase-like HAD family hydrolase
MQVIKSHRIVYFDVDDTLVIWDWKSIDPEGKGLLQIADPNSSHMELVLPHERHIALLKQFKARGHTVVVWSQGGWDWASSVVKSLG